MQNSIKHQQNLKSAFDLFDPQGSGYIRPSQLKNAIITMGVDHTKGMIYHHIKQLEEKTEFITYDMFIELMSNYTPEDTEEDIRKVYRLYDKQNKGFINEEDLRRVVEIVGEPMSDEEIRELLQIAGESNKVTFGDFYEMMTRNNFIFS